MNKDSIQAIASGLNRYEQNKMKKQKIKMKN